MEIEGDREEGRCPFPCNLSSLLSMNCRARAEGLARRLQTQVKQKNHPQFEGTLLVESDGKVRLAPSDGRAYSLDDHQLEIFQKASELKNLRPIHVVTSEPILHICLPPQPPGVDRPSPVEQEQDSDYYYDFDLVSPPDDYISSRESRQTSHGSIPEESDKPEREKPESGCVTSVTSPIVSTENLALPPSNPPSPLDDCPPELLNSRASDVDLEAVRQLLVSSKLRSLHTVSNTERPITINNNALPDFVGVVKGPRLSSSGSSDSDISSSESSSCSSGSERLVHEKEKKLILNEDIVSNSPNSSYELPPPSSYQIFSNHDGSFETSDIPDQPQKHKHKSPKRKHKKKKSQEQNKVESSDSNLDSSAEIQDYKPIKTHIAGNCSQKNGIPEEDTISNNSEINTRTDNISSIKHVSSVEILSSEEETGSNNHPKLRAKNSDEELQQRINQIEKQIEEENLRLSFLTEGRVLQEIDDAISLLKKDNNDVVGTKLAQYENIEVEAFGIKPNGKNKPTQQVSEIYLDLGIGSQDECQRLAPGSQECELCEEEVPFLCYNSVFRDEESDLDGNESNCQKIYDLSSQPDELNSYCIAEGDMPKSKGQSKGKRANSKKQTPSSPPDTEVPEAAATHANDISGQNLKFTKNVCCASVNNVESSLEEDHIPCEKHCLNNGENPMNCSPEACDIEDHGYPAFKLFSSQENNCTDKLNHKPDKEAFDNYIDSLIKENADKNTVAQSEQGEKLTVGDSLFNCNASLGAGEVSSNGTTVASAEASSPTDETFHSSNNIPDFPWSVRKGRLRRKKLSLEKQRLENASDEVSKCNDKSTDSNFSLNARDDSSQHTPSDRCRPGSDRKETEPNDCQCTSIPNCLEEKTSTSADRSTENKELHVSELTSSEGSSKQNSIEACKNQSLLPETESISNVMPQRSEKETLPATESNQERTDTESTLSCEVNADVGLAAEDAAPTKSSDTGEDDEEIETLPEDKNDAKEKDDEEDLEDEAIISGRFKNLSKYTERVRRTSESEDDGLPPPPTEVILVDYNEPLEPPPEEKEETKDISDDLASELTRLSLDEPTVQPPSDESERSSEEREADTDKQQRIKRSSSLRCGKTPPGTPGRKKIVRFADCLGLDLADIRTFLDGVPNVPPSAFCDLRVEDEANAGLEGSSSLPSYSSYSAAASAAAAILQNQARRILTPMFQQPGALPDFLSRLREQKVVLENVSVGSDLSVKGVVKVVNEAFHKKVFVRYTFDHWRNFHEATASYIDGSSDGFSDRFSFLLWGSFLQSNGSLVFCVKYCTNGNEYWDNNWGSNYVLQCYSAPPHPIPNADIRPLEGRPQNDSSFQHRQQSDRHHHDHSHGGTNYHSSFMGTPNTPTDPWVHRFF